ncbi:MAG: sigma-70 family RNA polymerase sigma factor [Myxococcales bacterium]|nr:sigma-70 family RNA polymerase sigma factor [Myxococcales bacterium]
MDATARAKLVEAHLDLAQRAARIVHRRIEGRMELAELVALANEGLAEAAQRFEEGHGATFATFAWYRVQGAVIDGVRRNTTLSRREWQKLSALRSAAEYLETRGERDRGAAQRGTAAPEGAEALRAVKEAMAAIKTVYLTSLEAMTETGRDPQSTAEHADETIDRSRMSRRIAIAIRRLPEREAALVKKHYYEGKNLLEAGAELGISKSWASRLHAQAVDRIRDFLDGEPRSGP